MDILNGQFIDFMMTQLQIDLLPQTINAKMRIAGFVLKGEEMREYLGFDNQEATDWEGRNRVLKKKLGFVASWRGFHRQFDD